VETEGRGGEVEEGGWKSNLEDKNETLGQSTKSIT
jgi:hypothetical protein